MATIQASSGQILDGSGAPAAEPSSPYDIYVKNMTGLMQAAQGASSQGNAALQGQIGGLQRGQVSLANPGSGNPLNFLYNMEPGSAQPASEATMGQIFQPAITSIQGQEDVAAKNIQGLTDQTNAQVNAYGVMKPNWQLSPVPDPNTGLPYFYNTNVGPGEQPQTFTPGQTPPGAAGETGANVPSTPSQLVGGIDLTGTATSTLPYATDPNYVKEVAGMYSNLQQAIPQASPDAIQGYIQSHAKGSPVTGAMIMNASSTYGIDPLALTAVLAHESDFGTAGAATDTNNPGNVGNTGASTKNFDSWQQGVNAAAQQLASRMPGNPNAPKNQNQAAPVGQAAFKDAPTVIQPAGRTTLSGDRYIVGSKLDANGTMLADVYSAKTKVPILDDGEVSAVQAIDSATKNLNTLYSYFNQIAPGGQVDSKFALSGGIAAKARFDIGSPISKMFDTNYGAAVTAYQNNRDALFQQINALAGSNPRINSQELITAANALPVVNWGNPDTLKDGEAKLARTYSILNNALSTFIPNAKGTQAPSSVANQYIPGSSGQSAPSSPGAQQTTPSGIKYTILQ